MRVDHIEVLVPSREEAAAWYGAALGFRVVEAFRDWAGPGGPLMIRRDDDEAMIALFEGRPQGGDDLRGFQRLAFRVSAPEFLRFMEGSGAWRDAPLGPADVKDHEKAISVYFSDPWGNPLEVTTYETDPVRAALPRDGAGRR